MKQGFYVVGGNSIEDLEEGLEALKKTIGETSCECKCCDKNEDPEYETCDKYCPNCNTEYQITDMEYCPYCGEQLVEDY